jgi:rare lipoprotein A
MSASRDERVLVFKNEKTYSSRIVLVFSNAFNMSSTPVALLLCVMCVVFTGCAKHKQARTPVQPPNKMAEPARIGATEKGEASWYGEPYNGRRAASGEIFDMEQLTAAHPTLPFQTWLEVTNLNNGKKVDVRITDRGPFVDGRIIDLSRAAAREIDMLRTGVAPVQLLVIPEPSDSPAPPAGSRGSPGGEFVVQAGAFADRNRAEAVRASLLELGDARLVPTNATPPLWRVWVGKDLTLDLASKLADEVKVLTGQAVVVRGR